MITSNRGNSFSPIEHHAIIGDCHCAALISKQGSLDWLCLPRFDSPAIFGALLDPKKGGHFKIAPIEEYRSEQRYIENTNVLETIFETSGGRLRLTDLMPIAGSRERAKKLFPQRQVLRIIECMDGEMEVALDFSPRFEYGRIIPQFHNRGRLGLFCGHRGLLLNLRTEFRLGIHEQEGCARGQSRLRQGDRQHVSLAFTLGEPAIIPPIGAEADLRIEQTITWWRDWASMCSYRGPYRDAVVRSALALKLMTYAPSGAVIAAPTSSLPEYIGSERNWDYRYCWLRDASMTLHALYKIGYTDEAEAFLSWLIHTTRLTRPELRVVYDVYGEKLLKEQELDHLEGYAKSRPVRIGNDASQQLQLDIYGEVVDGVFAFMKWGRSADRATASLLRGFGKTICNRWREPDAGIWEIRSEPRHFTFSKVMCWVALDRLIKMHASNYIRGPIEKYTLSRDAIRAEIETLGFCEEIQSYTSSFGSEEVDVSLLLLPVFGYIEANHPRMRSTFARIRKQLGRGVLLYRYPLHYDGLPAGEGTFAAGSFWAIECLARQGDYQAACRSFEHLLALSNHVGLFAEEIDPHTGAALGNFPQAYTHVGLINAALILAEVEKYSAK